MGKTLAFITVAVVLLLAQPAAALESDRELLALAAMPLAVAAVAVQVPERHQLPGPIADAADREGRGVVALPPAHHRAADGMAPEQVRGAVAIEVASTQDVPGQVPDRDQVHPPDR